MHYPAEIKSSYLLSIVVPVYNEKPWLGHFWKRLMAAPLDQCEKIERVEILLVDDGSTDRSPEVLRELAALQTNFDCGVPVTTHLIVLPENRGKGFALRRGIQASKGDIVLVQDADMEYSPADYPTLLRPITSGIADVVYGSRFTGDCRRVLYFWHSVVNRALTLMSNALNDLNLTDMETGYKVIRGDLARSLKLTSERFGIEPELTSRLARSKARIYEVPVSYQGRSYEDGKKIGVKDGIAAFFHILRFALWDREVFVPGLWQSLSTLDRHAKSIYGPVLDRALAGAPSRPRILEVGAGIGSLTQILARYGDVVATDLCPQMTRAMQERFRLKDHVTVRQWDATQPTWDGQEKFDFIFAINILEHIDKDSQALALWKSLLKPGGRLILLVPNLPALYSPLDRELGHFRRYRHQELVSRVEEQGLKVARFEYDNPVGIFGWWFNGKVLGKNSLPSGQVFLYSLFKPLFRPFEVLLRKRMGLNLIVHAHQSLS